MCNFVSYIFVSRRRLCIHHSRYKTLALRPIHSRTKLLRQMDFNRIDNCRLALALPFARLADGRHLQWKNHFSCHSFCHLVRNAVNHTSCNEVNQLNLKLMAYDWECGVCCTLCAVCVCVCGNLIMFHCRTSNSIQQNTVTSPPNDHTVHTSSVPSPYSLNTWTNIWNYMNMNCEPCVSCAVKHNLMLFHELYIVKWQ